MSDLTALANSSAPIPIAVPGRPAQNPTDANFTGRLESPHLLPLPPSNESYGGTAEQPAWFYNRSLSADDIVCGTSNWTIRRVCCPRSLGIMNGDWTAGANCRMHAREENAAYWMNCTHQLGQEHGAGAVASACWPLQQFMDYRVNDTFKEVIVSDEKTTRCAGVDQPSAGNNYTTGHNYTDHCCAEVGGKPSTWFSDLPDAGSREQNRSNWMASDCNTKDPDAFRRCMDKYTWSACLSNESGALRSGASTVVIAAAALALLV